MRTQQNIGLYRKFNVSRTDGRDQPGGDRDGAMYFVLDVTYDPFAKTALAAYAAACMADYPQLASDLVRKDGLQSTQTTTLQIESVLKDADHLDDVSDKFLQAINNLHILEADADMDETCINVREMKKCWHEFNKYQEAVRKAIYEYRKHAYRFRKSLRQQPIADKSSAVSLPSGEAVAWTKDAENWGNALNEAGLNFIEACPEKSVLLFNNCKPALRSAILKYAELVGQAATPTQAPDGWQDIDSGPKDGRAILLGYFNSHGNWRTMRGQWFTKEYIDFNWEDGDLFAAGWYETSVEADDAPSCWPTNPTHWMPLPAAPQPKGGER